MNSRKIRSTIAASVGSISRSPVVRLPALNVLTTRYSETQAARRFAVLDSPAQSTVRFLGQVFEEEGVHRALESDVEVRDVALRQRHDVHAGECQTFEQTGGVFLVAAESIQRLGEDYVETPVERIPHQRLESRAEKYCTRDSATRVVVRDRPALSLRKRAADPELIRDGGIALIVRRVPRVDPDYHVFLKV